ncbi:MAG: hypothetical protein NTV21_04260 [Planctomycetota bacterium]|nr:hypothetical protein [Planctomycetota bacterium]
MLTTSILLAASLLGLRPMDAGQTEPVAPSASAVAPWREELVERAWRAATAMPLVPHVKNRSRAQESVVDACLELGLAGKAEKLALEIVNWRSAAALSSVALHHARGGRAEEARRVAHATEALITKNTAEAAQEWQDERVRARLAATYVWIGDKADAARLAPGIGESEAGAVQSAVAAKTSPEDADARFAAIDKAVTAGGFENVRNALQACAELHARCWDDVERRERAERTIREGWSLLPLRVRIDLLASLAKTRIEHGAEALALVTEIRTLIDGAQWLPEDRAPLRAQVATLRYQAGERQEARRELDAALAGYTKDRTEIVDIYRAGALRPVAEAYATMGDPDEARRVFARALEEGTLNPNSRPRADDLVATCLAMAKAGVEPDATLRVRLEQIAGAFGDPW